MLGRIERPSEKIKLEHFQNVGIARFAFTSVLEKGTPLAMAVGVSN